MINNRYIILSIETVSNFSDNDNNNKLFIKAFLMFLEKLFKDDTLESVLEKIQYTNLYYFIKRAQIGLGWMLKKIQPTVPILNTG